MKNITVSIPDHIYRNARIKAARRNTSVSALVRKFLDSLSDLPYPILDSASPNADRNRSVQSVMNVPGSECRISTRLVRPYPYPPIYRETVKL